MKNIHILPTYNQSRLYYFNGKKSGFYLYPSNQLLTPENNVYSNQYIYITSDEEIENCWFVNLTNNEIGYIKNNIGTQKNAKKIILTTDIDLIKDGVQAIHDEFLEWFVNNPSCESVEINFSLASGSFKYKIIIPKEEPKLKNICIKCGVDLYATEGRFECQKHPKECKGIILPRETLQEWADKEEQKQHLIDMMKADEELGLYEEPYERTTQSISLSEVDKEETIEDKFQSWNKLIKEIGSEEELLEILELPHILPLVREAMKNNCKK